MILNLPNFICIFRVFLTFFAFWHFYTNPDSKNLFFLLTVLIIYMDALDGYFARKLNQTTDFGAKLDIICDRIVELAYWLFFGLTGVIHVWIFFFFLLRGIIVDYLSRNSKVPLGDSFLRSSRFMRGAYGFFKLLSFSLLILCPYYLIPASSGLSFIDSMPVAYLISYITVVLCFLRALPVLIDQFKKV